MPAMCGFFSKPIPRKDDQKEKREKIGKRSGKCSTFFSPRLENYPLVNIQKTMENQENPWFWWVKSTISMAIFNSFCMFTRPGIPVNVVNPTINDQPSKIIIFYGYYKLPNGRFMVWRVSQKIRGATRHTTEKRSEKRGVQWDDTPVGSSDGWSVG